MPVVWIPALLQPLTRGQQQVEAPGATVRQVIEALETAYPGIEARLCGEAGRLKPEIAVAVDGEVKPEGLRARVSALGEVHFLPALQGG